MNKANTSTAQASGALGALGAIHGKTVASRRTRVLAAHLSALISPDTRVLDIGCGDGSIAAIIARTVPGVCVEGIDVLIRANTHISVRPFDGLTIPYPRDSFDFAILVDVLHHARDPLGLLREAARIAKTILIKDHFRHGFLAGATLSFMDWVGNAPHGVGLTYSYWTGTQWNSAFREIGLEKTWMETRLRLYPAPASWFFDRQLHFLARCRRIGQPRP